MALDAVTAKGSRLTRRLVLDAGTKQGGWDELRQRCRTLSPGDALEGEIAAASWTGSTVRLTYGVRNIGALPLTLEAVRYEPGVSLKVLPGPLVLPAGPGPDPGPTRRLVVELRVSSCSQLEAALRQAEGGDGLDGWGTLKLQLRHAHGGGPGLLDLGGHSDRLARTCRSIDRYLGPEGG